MSINGHDGNCDCREGRYENKTGEIVETLPVHVHSCAYIQLRNLLIPTAAAFADLKVPDDRGGRRWSRLFSKRMAELMREGIRGAE